jgi:hypothetical protein
MRKATPHIPRSSLLFEGSFVVLLLACAVAIAGTAYLIVQSVLAVAYVTACFDHWTTYVFKAKGCIS